MTNKIEKYLRKLSRKKRDMILERMVKIRNGTWETLDVKSLKGGSNLYRDKIGNTRIIFIKTRKGGIEIDAIVKRDENTYQNYR